MTEQVNQEHPSPLRRTASALGPGAQLRRPRAAASARRSKTTAQCVVAALALPASSRATSYPLRPPPLTSLHQLTHDTSMLYGIGRVDTSGRVANADIVEALRWQPGDKLEMIFSQGTIIIRASPDGLFPVPRRPRIIIPATARRRCAIRPGDHVLLAAALSYGIVIVYPLPVVGEMIARYHSAYSAGESART
jgi:bifunctional DNA-binding transcriptional regulator/antitoxin component of YhaV-PrlF toxin-antitoxin module